MAIVRTIGCVGNILSGLTMLEASFALLRNG